jgi:hypothetical protein
MLELIVKLDGKSDQDLRQQGRQRHPGRLFDIYRDHPGGISFLISEGI